MSDLPAHVRTWAAHKASAEALTTLVPPHPSAAIILTFYAALHLTQGYLSAKGERFEATNHTARRGAIRRAPELGRPFRIAYDALQELSESVRYDPNFLATIADVTKAAGWLRTIESFLVAKLRAKGVEVPS